MSACTLNPFLDPTEALRIPEWYVWVEGGDPVGPVSANQIARGIRAGKVPGDAQIARGGGGQWEEALEAGAVLEALKALPEESHAARALCHVTRDIGATPLRGRRA